MKKNLLPLNEIYKSLKIIIFKFRFIINIWKKKRNSYDPVVEFK